MSGVWTNWKPICRPTGFSDGDVRYWADCENGDWYYRCAVTEKPLVRELNEPVLTELEKAIISISKENIAKCGIKICG